MNNEFTIVIDTNEQKPFFSGRNAPKGIPIIRDNLKPHGGDYSVLGYESRIIIERKEAHDFLTSITSERERFFKTFSLLRAHEVRYIMIESLFWDILSICDPTALRKYKTGKISPVRYCNKRAIHPNVVIESVKSIMGKHQIPIWFATNRREAEKITLGILQKFHEAQMENNK
jgi:ERCC4-type nuclease